MIKDEGVTVAVKGGGKRSQWKTSAKSDERFQGATSETCLRMHFYTDPEIFMLFVKYSCEPVCELVPGGRMSRNWRDPTISLSFCCANVTCSRDTWGRR